MSELISVESFLDIPQQFRNTPIGLLFEYHNLSRPFDRYTTAKLLVGMCMDNRKHLIIPDNFSYIIRTGGANLRHSEFKVSYAIAVGGVRYVALIGHNHCGMVDLHKRKQQFINGMVEGAGWTDLMAREHFEQFAPQFELNSAADFILNEVERLQLRYPAVVFAPLYYLVESGKLFFLKTH